MAVSPALLATLAALSGPQSTPVTLTAEPAALHGTLLRPEAEVRAAAVIIPGSGPTDRDGNSPLGVNGGMFKQLAEALAAKGIASVRIDKRGIAQSQPAGVDERVLSFDTYATDAANWASLVREQTNVPCVWLIGHSEGALVAQVAATQSTDVCGLVLLSGTGRTADVVIREQLKAGLPEAMKAEAFATLDALAAGRTVEAPPPALAALFRPSVQPYLISYLTIDPARLARDYDRPVFIGQGTTDLQTRVADAEALKAAQPDATLKIWDGLNHLLTQAPMDRAANFATYNANSTLDPQVSEDVAAFILAPR